MYEIVRWLVNNDSFTDNVTSELWRTSLPNKQSHFTCENASKTIKQDDIYQLFISCRARVHRQQVTEDTFSEFRSQSIPSHTMRVFSKVNVVLRVCSRNYGFTAIRRDYGPEAVEKLRGSLKIEQTLARRGAERLWELINRGEDSYVNALGAMTGMYKKRCLKLNKTSWQELKI